jgi:hypothetical protein
MNEEQLKASLWINVTEEMGVDDKGIALAIHLRDKGTFTPSDFEEAQHWVDCEDYLVATDEEAYEECVDYISETLWAFNASFLAGETGLSEEVFTRLAEGYESSNEAIEALIDGTCGMGNFIQSAISADGRGHFLAGYDHEENEVTYNGTTYYIYRRN